jgi:hypothetical protein
MSATERAQRRLESRRALSEALRRYGVAVLGDLSPQRIVAIAMSARRPTFRTATRRRTR